jgi:hypothetical protein
MQIKLLPIAQLARLARPLRPANLGVRQASHTISPESHTITETIAALIWMRTNVDLQRTRTNEKWLKTATFPEIQPCREKRLAGGAR